MATEKQPTGVWVACQGIMQHAQQVTHQDDCTAIEMEQCKHAALMVYADASIADIACHSYTRQKPGQLQSHCACLSYLHTV